MNITEFGKEPGYCGGPSKCAECREAEAILEAKEGGSHER